MIRIYNIITSAILIWIIFYFTATVSFGLEPSRNLFIWGPIVFVIIVLLICVVIMVLGEIIHAYRYNKFDFQRKRIEEKRRQKRIELGREPEEYRVFEVKNKVTFKMVKVPGGKFIMGSNDNDAYNSVLEHEETVEDFYIGETVVTHDLYACVAGGKKYYRQDNGEYPCVCESYFDCLRWLKELKKVTGEDFRLPTEVEWEYAARGGNKNQNYYYSGSNDIAEVAWYDKNSKEKDKNTGYKKYEVHKVAQLLPNELGLYDMSGNVAEWCHDVFRKYDNNHPEKKSSDTYTTVVRGGSYISPKELCSVYSRWVVPADTMSDSIGFRLVWIPKTKNN